MDQNNFRQIVGSQVRLHRKAQGLSQERLAELAELHHTYICNIERGKVSASAYSFYKIAQALGIKFVDLLGLVDLGYDSDFENDWVDIMGKIRQMDDVQRSLYLGAIQGLLPKKKL